jgi:hypothetical protein
LKREREREKQKQKQKSTRGERRGNIVSSINAEFMKLIFKRYHENFP